MNRAYFFYKIVLLDREGVKVSTSASTLPLAGRPGWHCTQPWCGGRPEPVEWTWTTAGAPSYFTYWSCSHDQKCIWFSWRESLWLFKPHSCIRRQSLAQKPDRHLLPQSSGFIFYYHPPLFPLQKQLYSFQKNLLKICLVTPRFYVLKFCFLKTCFFSQVWRSWQSYSYN